MGAVVLCSTCQSVVPLLERVASRASLMFGTRAYWYQYQQRGATEEGFRGVLAHVEQVRKRTHWVPVIKCRPSNAPCRRAPVCSPAQALFLRTRNTTHKQMLVNYQRLSAG
jgi:hypothetical protein